MSVGSGTRTRAGASWMRVIEEVPTMDPTKGTAKASGRRVAGLVLSGFGAPTSFAFLFFLFPMRNAPPLWTNLTERGHIVVLAGSAVGIILLVAGRMLRGSRQPLEIKREAE